MTIFAELDYIVFTDLCYGIEGENDEPVAEGDYYYFYKNGLMGDIYRIPVSEYDG